MNSNKTYQIKQFINFHKRSKNQYGIHSPFVFELVQEVFHKSKEYYSFSEIENLRKKLKKNKTEIQVTDLGAGSNVLKSKKRKISDITRLSSSPPNFAQIIFRLANKFQPELILELGTSVGILTSYLSKSCPNSKIITFEGCPNICSVADSNFKELKLENIEIIEGNMDQTLKAKLSAIPSCDFAVIDGNHTEEATLHYFNLLLEKSNADTIMVFDDIYWSPGMTRAWDKIKEHPKVSLSLDLYKIGIVFFREGMEKQDFKIRI